MHPYHHLRPKGVNSMTRAGISIFDDDMETVSPSIEYLFAGRYKTDEYVPMENENGGQDMMHKVTINLVLDNEQFVAMMGMMAKGESITMKLI